MAHQQLKKLSDETTSVAIALYDAVDDLGAAGPGLVFNAANAVSERPLFRVFTVAADREPLRTIGGLSVMSDFAALDAPMPDVLVLPGASGTRAPLRLPSLMAWIERALEVSRVVVTLCTGIRLLSRSGLARGMTATSHPDAVEIMQEAAPGIRILPDRVLYDNGRVIAASGLNGGLEASLAVVRRYHGLETAITTARHLEYQPLELVRP